MKLRLGNVKMTDYVMEELQTRPIVSWHKLTDKIVVTKRVHHMYKGWLHMRKTMPDYTNLMGNQPLIGRWHYVYRSEKGRISLIKLTDWLYQGHPWEICGGGFTEDIERYATKEDAEVRIKELLE